MSGTALAAGSAAYGRSGEPGASALPLTGSRRGGAVIIVVLALLSLMIFLGVFFFEFVQEEQLAAQNYANNLFDPLNPDRYFGEGDKQLIIGPDASRTMSALSAGDAYSTTAPAGLTYGTPGSVHSLLAHVIGRMQPAADGLHPTDVLPHNGHGITTIFRAGTEDANSDGIFTPGTEYVSFDFDGDGNADSVLDPSGVSGSALPAFGINFSRPAQPNPALDAFSQTAANALRPFQPDVEYTYTDINNLFLANDVEADATNDGIDNPVRIRVPSFHRPDLFPTQRSTGNFADLYTNPNTARLVMRPHSFHRHPDGTARFLTAATTAQSGDRSRQIPPFPFYIDSNNDNDVNDMGPYSYDSTNGVLKQNYDLDADLTGDGEPDGIWMDLGMDIVDMADGRQFVPLVSFHILDADSLINLNTAGNTQGVFENGAVYNNTTPIQPYSVSNTGASASEVNPMRALTGNPGVFSGSPLTQAQTEHAAFFGFSASTAQSISTMANMETWFLTAGRTTSRSGARLTGRYGEENLVGTATLPRPGATGFDDDYDNTPDGVRYQGGWRRYQSLYDPRAGATAVSVLTPHATHPVDPKGTGSAVFTATGVVLNAATDIVVNAATGTPVVWPLYEQRWEYPQSTALGAGSTPTVEAIYPYGPAVAPADTSLFPAGYTTMQDEDDETRIANPDRVYDDIFRTEEALKLQLSSADYQRIGASSRLAALAPFNFVVSHTAPETLRRFTPDSWDFSELAYVPSRFDTMTSSRTETSVWTGTRRFFPPAFTGVGVFTDTDPIRPEVRALLASEDSNYPASGTTIPSRRESFDLTSIPGAITTPSLSSPVPLWRQPLNLNKLLVGFDADGYPVFRDLMPHPDIVALENQDTSGLMTALTIPAMIHGHDPSVASGQIPATAAFTNIIATPTTDAQREQTAVAMEWWARYDRQRMARDIYTLLYLVGAPNGTNPATDAATTVYPEEEKIREMAQFAVNYVDALDRDDVITKFEYDNNLSDGWNTSPSKVVYGIERASLSFSEVQFLQTKFQTSDFTTTLHDDKDDLHQFLHIELRNSSPFTVSVAEGWRISRVVTGKGTRDRSVQYKTKGFGTATASLKQVAPGGNFLIGTHDGTVKNATGTIVTSDFYADIAGGSELESVLPYSTSTITNNSANPNPQTDLDLSISGLGSPNDHENYITYVAGTSGYAGTRLVQMVPMTAPAQVTFDLVLERRQNVNGVEAATNDSTTSSMGEWIEVDRFHLNSDDMDTSTNTAEFSPGTDDQTTVATALSTLNSVERRQPFDPVQINHAAGSTSNHTIRTAAATKHAANSVGITPFTLWHPHFDRDFTSAYELLSVPLYGNWPLSELVSGTSTGATTADTFYKEIHGGTQFLLAPGAVAGSSGKLTGDFTAGVRFNFPNGVPGQPYQGWNPYAYQNCWYRLFDFVTVPRRADQQSEEILAGTNSKAGSTRPVFRVPGKINLNTMRDETILAALLDDAVHLNYGNTNATDDNLTTGRNWFLELLQSRDGTDYFADLAGVPGVPIPNSLVSRPFRGTSPVDSGAATNFDDRSIENGLLRSSPQRGGTVFGPRPVGAAYTAPTLNSPANFTATGLWNGPAPHDTSAVTWQGLFESDDLDDAAYPRVDHHTRNRILAKIANNSTNKSHVYFVWMGVGYFEAHRESTSGNNNVQIGARLTDIPVHRRFSVVDMSQLENAYDTQSNTFDEKKFIIFQKRLR